MKADNRGIRFQSVVGFCFLFTFSAVCSPSIIWGERKEKVKRFSAVACVQPVYDEFSENQTFPST